MNKITGCKETCSDGTVFYWSSPYSFKRYKGSHLIDSSRRASGMTAEQAHKFCDENSIKQQVSGV